MITQQQRQNAKKYNLKFAVNQRYFDSGKVEAWVETCNPNCHDSSEERGSYDFYFTVFDTEDEANVFKQECLEA